MGNAPFMIADTTVLVRSFELAERAVTNEDWLAFMADRGYIRPDIA